MNPLDRYSKQIKKIILANNEFAISEVIGLISVYSSVYDEDRYPGILNFLKAQKFDQLSQSTAPENAPFREYLEVYKFADRSGHEYLATVYDSDELWQNPQIIDLIAL